MSNNNEIERLERFCAPCAAFLRVEGSASNIWGLGFRVQGVGFRVEGLEFRVEGSGLWVSGLRVCF